MNHTPPPLPALPPPLPRAGRAAPPPLPRQKHDPLDDLIGKPHPVKVIIGGGMLTVAMAPAICAALFVIFVIVAIIVGL
jgi:hypothetical protein